MSKKLCFKAWFTGRAGQKNEKSGGDAKEDGAEKAQ